MRIVRGVYERYGFEPLETPAFENIETLMGKYGEEGNQLIFKILRRGEHEATGTADLALRYDLTVPLARVVAQYQNELPRYFKRYQIQPVWRADRPARGRFREFYQCDVDAIGSTSPIAEVEQIAAVSEVLTTLGFHDFVVGLNHRLVLRSLLRNAGIEADRQSEALVALDKIDKIGRDGVAKELVGRGIAEQAGQKLLEWIGAGGEGDRLAWLEEQFADVNEEERAGFQNLRDILSLVARTPAEGKVRFAPSLARGLSYYTGAIMEISVPDLAGSLGGGGRYDNLVGMFSGRDVPACGFSLGLERIIVVMTERNMFPAALDSRVVDIVVTFMEDASRADALALASALRARTLRVDVFPEASRKFDKPLKYASGRGAAAMAIFGETERLRGEVSVRNLQTREQGTVPLDAAAEHIVALVTKNP